MTERIVAPDGTVYVAFLDVSGWQHNYAGHGRVEPGAEPPDLTKAKTAGFAGVFARVGNGTSRDESFPLVHAAAAAAGLPVGGYYYAQPNTIPHPPAAVDLVAQWVDGRELGLPLMLDWEAYYGDRLAPKAAYTWIDGWGAAADDLYPHLSESLLYAGKRYVDDLETLGGFARDTVQPRYPRNTACPPIPLEQWSDWIPWDLQPAFTSVLGAWDGWQFSSSGWWSTYGAPPDAATDRVDVNIVPVDIWNRWTAPRKGPFAMSYQPLDHLPDPRFVDTRIGLGATRLQARREQRIQIPPEKIGDDGATAAVVNLTIVAPDGGGHLIVWPKGQRPKASKINFVDGQTIANEVTIGLDELGGFQVWAYTDTELLCDLSGLHRP